MDRLSIKYLTVALRATLANYVNYRQTALVWLRQTRLEWIPIQVKLPTPALGGKTSGCNRIAPSTEVCDALKYHNPDWSNYANGTVHRGI